MKSHANRALSALCCLLAAFFALVPGIAAAQTPGFEPQTISRAGDLDPGQGAVILSVRSEIYLVARLDVWFLREGGDPANEGDLVRVSRSESALSFGGNSTTRYRPQALQLLPGRYRLIGHGIKCPKVPAPEERCLVDVKVAGIGQTLSFPSRGYGEDAPVFEVRAGAVTLAGDFALTARNVIEWSAIPEKPLTKVARRFDKLPDGPEPEVSKSFRLRFPLRPRSMSDDIKRRY